MLIAHSVVKIQENNAKSMATTIRKKGRVGLIVNKYKKNDFL
jgi:hypothetical protein